MILGSMENGFFFATSHGKGAGDGLGGTCKRAATKASLQGQVIQTPLDFFNWCNSNLKGVKCIYVSKEEIELNDTFLQPRFKFGKRIKGTHKFHSFTPVDSTTVEARYICSSNESFRFQVVKQNTNTTRSIDFKGIKPDSVVACVYEEGGLWYLAKVFENNEITSELKVKYFIPGGERSIVTGFQTKLERNYTFLT